MIISSSPSVREEWLLVECGVLGWLSSAPPPLSSGQTLSPLPAACLPQESLMNENINQCTGEMRERP